MKLWKDYVNEVREKGFEKASPIARLIWSCETENGINQHASCDLIEIADALEAARELCKYLREHVEMTLPDALIVADLEQKFERV